MTGNSMHKQTSSHEASLLQSPNPFLNSTGSGRLTTAPPAATEYDPAWHQRGEPSVNLLNLSGSNGSCMTSDWTPLINRDKELPHPRVCPTTVPDQGHSHMEIPQRPFGLPFWRTIQFPDHLILWETTPPQPNTTSGPEVIHTS